MPDLILSATKVNKRFASSDGELKILNDLDLQVTRGESIAIVGVSGSGKSTLLSLLAGLDVPDSGTIELAGVEITKLSEAARSSLRVQKLSFVFQDFMLLPHLTALENVLLPLEMLHIKAAVAREKATAELEKVGLAARAGHFPSQLSGGEQQRTALARAFATEPLLLFADEPNGNLDLQTGAQVIKLLFELNRQQQTTLLVVTHDLALARKCDKVFELAEGRLHQSA